MSASLRDYSRRHPYYLSSRRTSTDRPRERAGLLRKGERVLAEVPRGGDGDGTRTVHAIALDHATIQDDNGVIRCLFRILKRFF